MRTAVLVCALNNHVKQGLLVWILAHKGTRTINTNYTCQYVVAVPLTLATPLFKTD